MREYLRAWNKHKDIAVIVDMIEQTLGNRLKKLKDGLSKKEDFFEFGEINFFKKKKFLFTLGKNEGY